VPRSIEAELFDGRCGSVIHALRFRADKGVLTIGFVPNVVFPCAALCDSETGRVAIYYGAADTHVAVAFGYIDEIVEFVKRNSM